MPLPSDEKIVKLANELLEQLHAMFGANPGFRAAHAKGMMLSGTFTLQDVLNLGAAARMNMPGQARGNWRWRLTDELLSPAAFDWLAHLTKETNRASSTGGSAPSPAVHSAGAGSPALQETEVTR